MAGVTTFGLLRAAGQLDLFISVSYLVLLGFVGTLMMTEALRTLLRRRAGVVIRDKLPSQHTWMHGLPLRIRFKKSRLYISVLPVLAIGLFIGWVGALLGIGGGFILVPALIYFFKPELAEGFRRNVRTGPARQQILGTARHQLAQHRGAHPLAHQGT
eukprot:gene14716-19896_t